MDRQRSLGRLAATAPLALVVVLAVSAMQGARAVAPVGLDNGHRLLLECDAAIRLLDEGTLPPALAGPASYCLGFISGAARLVAITEPLKPGGQLFCPEPEGIDIERAVRAVHAYLHTHRERLHAARITLVAAALAGEYPCPPADPQFDARMRAREPSIPAPGEATAR